MVLVSFGLSVSLTSAAPDAGFYLPFSRFWELGLGCLLALRRRSAPLPPLSASGAPMTLRDLFPALGLILIATAILAFDHSSPFPGWRALLPVIGTLLILAAPEEGWFQHRVLGGPVLVYVGLISYSLYLWHWPLLSFVNILHQGLPPASLRWAVLLLSIALAALTYHVVEVPIRRRREFKINAALGAGAGFACLAGLIVYATAGIPQRFDVDIQALRHGPRVDPLCRSQVGENYKINYCRTTHAQPPHILVLGDSKAHAIYEAIAAVFASQYAVMLLGRGGCPPLLNVRIAGDRTSEPDCPEIWQRFVSYARDAKPRVIVLVGNGSFLLRRPGIELSPLNFHSSDGKQAVFEYGLRSLVTELTRASPVIHVAEIPAFATSPSCLLRPMRLPSTHCEPHRKRSDVETAMNEYNEVLALLQPAFPTVLFLNTTDLLCTSELCSQWPSGGPLLYSDTIHLSTRGAELFVEKAELPKTITTWLAKSNSAGSTR
jgi:hypothetical protein